MTQPGYVRVDNLGGGIMNWTALVSYTTGSGWLTLDTTSGENNRSVMVRAVPQGLAAGTIRLRSSSMPGRSREMLPSS